MADSAAEVMDACLGPAGEPVRHRRCGVVAGACSGIKCLLLGRDDLIPIATAVEIVVQRPREPPDMTVKSLRTGLINGGHQISVLGIEPFHRLRVVADDQPLGTWRRRIQREGSAVLVEILGGGEAGVEVEVEETPNARVQVIAAVLVFGLFGCIGAHQVVHLITARMPVEQVDLCQRFQRRPYAAGRLACQAGRCSQVQVLAPWFWPRIWHAVLSEQRPYSGEAGSG